LKMFLPAAVLGERRAITLSAAADGVELGAETYARPGAFVYRRRLAQPARQVRLDFHLDHALAPDAADPRERGIIVSALDLE
jgi:hypothetical protein